MSLGLKITINLAAPWRRVVVHWLVFGVGYNFLVEKVVRGRFNPLYEPLQSSPFIFYERASSTPSMAVIYNARLCNQTYNRSRNVDSYIYLPAFTCNMRVKHYYCYGSVGARTNKDTRR